MWIAFKLCRMSSGRSDRFANAVFGPVGVHHGKGFLHNAVMWVRGSPFHSAPTCVRRGGGSPLGTRRGGALVVVLAVALVLALAVIAWLIWLRPPAPIVLSAGEANTLQNKIAVLQSSSHSRDGAALSNGSAWTSGADRPLIDFDDRRDALIDLPSQSSSDLARDAETVERTKGIGGDTNGVGESDSPESQDRLAVYAPDLGARHLRFSEREVNALLERGWEQAGAATQTLGASPLRVRVRFSSDQISVATWIDFGEGGGPFGMKNLRVDTGLRMVKVAASDQNVLPRAELVGVSIGGIPLPRRWLEAFFGADALSRLMPVDAEAMNAGLRGFGLEGVKRLEVEDGVVAVVLAE